MRNKKEIFMMFLLVAMFAIVGCMFYYQNFYLKESEGKNQAYIAIAKKDIAKGDKFTEGENFTFLPIEKKYVQPGYIAYDSQKQYNKLMTGKIANSPILKNETITKGRLTDKPKTEDNVSLFVNVEKMKVNAQKGDRINIYVQMKYKDAYVKDLTNYETYKLMENVIVENVIAKQNSQGKESTGVVQYLEVHVPESVALNYHMALYSTEMKSNILVLKAEDVFDEINSNLKPLEKMRGYTQKKDQFIQNNGEVSLKTKAKHDSNVNQLDQKAQSKQLQEKDVQNEKLKDGAKGETIPTGTIVLK